MQQIKRMLIPTDGCTSTREAVAEGLRLAKLMNCDVTALYVIDKAHFPDVATGYSLDLRTALRQEGDTAVQYVRQEGRKLGLEIEMLVEEGSPAAHIVELSKDYDLIVMGTLGRTGVAKLLLGSVAEKVVRFASCPVYVVRPHSNPVGKGTAAP